MTDRRRSLDETYVDTDLANYGDPLDTSPGNVAHLEAEVVWLRQLVRMMDHEHRAYGGSDWHLPASYAALLGAIINRH